MRKDWLSFEELSIQEVLQVLPHRFPFVMVDRVLSVKTGKAIAKNMEEKDLNDARKGTVARAIKNVTFNEIQFLGHFPEAPVLPGVLTMEALAQTGAFATVPFVAALHDGHLPKMRVALAGFDSVRFRKPIIPGDQMFMTVEVKQTRGPIWSFSGLVEVDGKKVAEGEFMAQLLFEGEKNE